MITDVSLKKKKKKGIIHRNIMFHRALHGQEAVRVKLHILNLLYLLVIICDLQVVKHCHSEFGCVWGGGAEFIKFTITYYHNLLLLLKLFLAK